MNKITIEMEEISIHCPLCGHAIAPPEYPYCSHAGLVAVCVPNEDVIIEGNDGDLIESIKEYLERNSESEFSEVELVEQFFAKAQNEIDATISAFEPNLSHSPATVLVGIQK